MTSQRTRARLVRRLEEQGINSSEVLDVISSTPRHLFLDEALAHRAYEDTALPIGHGQTLSQPYIVARMTQALIEVGVSLDRVLEIGTGSGYQTAVLAQLVGHVFTVERIKALQQKAKMRFNRLRLRNVTCRYSDGGVGWPEQAPFQGVISTAAPRDIPDALLQQLAPGGVLVIPVGDNTQTLHRVIRDINDDTFHTEVLEPVKFVPFVSGVLA